MTRSQHAIAAVCSAAIVLMAMPAWAQPGPGGPGAGRGMGPGMSMGPGMMMGPGMGRGMMGGPGFGRGGVCDPAGAGFAEWRAAEIEKALTLTDAQRNALKDLQSASSKAAETLSAACPAEAPASSAARLAFMEKRMDAMLQAIKTVRPAFDAFYATLTDEQKKRLDQVAGRGRHRGWGWGRN